MIVDYFHMGRAAIGPFEAYAPLIVDTDAVLTGAFPLQFLQSVSRGRLQIAQFLGGLKVGQLSNSRVFECSEPSRAATFEQCFGIVAAE